MYSFLLALNRSLPEASLVSVATSEQRRRGGCVVIVEGGKEEITGDVFLVQTALLSRNSPRLETTIVAPMHLLPCCTKSSTTNIWRSLTELRKDTRNRAFATTQIIIEDWGCTTQRETGNGYHEKEKERTVTRDALPGAIYRNARIGAVYACLLLATSPRHYYHSPLLLSHLDVSIRPIPITANVLEVTNTLCEKQGCMSGGKKMVEEVSGDMKHSWKEQR